jgi:hypothetical protein
MSTTTSNQSYQHSKALISYLITTYSKQRAAALSSTSPPLANAATLQLERSLKRLAVEQARAASASHTSASTTASEASGTDTEDEEVATVASNSSVDGSHTEELTEDDK